MNKKKLAFRTRRISSFVFVLGLAQIMLFTQCRKDDDELPTPSNQSSASEITAESAAIKNTGQTVYTIKTNQEVFDGSTMDIQPGSTIKIEGGNRGPLLIKNISGTSAAPILIVNSGQTTIQSSGSYGLKTENCQFFRVSGAGDGNSTGIVVDGGQIGMTFDKLSSDFEVDHIEVKNCGFAGIMAKTDPSCDKETWRGNFLMKNLKLHDNYIHDVKGEGFYVGNSFYENGRDLECGSALPHEVQNVEIFNNHVKNSGCEGIQAGCVTTGLRIYNNTVENFGIDPFADAQNNGVQIGEGSAGEMFNNIIKDGPGNGIIILGRGETKIYNNLILNPGSYGAFIDDRGPSTGEIAFVNNTFVNPKQGGIKTYNEFVQNRFINNIIAGTSEYFIYGNSATGEELNNLTEANVSSVGFVSPGSDNYQLNSNSPAVNQGTEAGIPFDLSNQSRPASGKTDIGAYEL